MRYTGIVTECGKVDFTRGASGAKLQELVEDLQIANVDDLAHIAFDIGNDVVCQPDAEKRITINNLYSLTKERRLYALLSSWQAP
jgi:hypothetical protein